MQVDRRSTRVLEGGARVEVGGIAVHPERTADRGGRADDEILGERDVVVQRGVQAGVEGKSRSAGPVARSPK
jgi:hypothetical protein